MIPDIHHEGLTTVVVLHAVIEQNVKCVLTEVAFIPE